MSRKKTIKKTEFEKVRPTFEDSAKVYDFMQTVTPGMLLILAESVPVLFYRACFDVPMEEHDTEAIKRAHAIQHFFMSARRFFSLLSTERISTETMSLDQRYNTLMIRSGDENWIDGQFGLFFPEFQHIKISTPLINKQNDKQKSKARR